jgi:hypothetical protein
VVRRNLPKIVPSQPAIVRAPKLPHSRVPEMPKFPITAEPKTVFERLDYATLAAYDNCVAGRYRCYPDARERPLLELAVQAQSLVFRCGCTSPV